MVKNKNYFNKFNYSKIALIITVICTSYLYVFFDWLFLVTKPSFVSVLTNFEKIKILFYTGALLSTTCIILLLPFFLILSFCNNKYIISLSYTIGLLIPTLVLSALVLMLVDNFSYTLLNFGIISTDGFLRYLYGFAFIVLIYFLKSDVYKLTKFIEVKWLNKKEGSKHAKPIIISISILLFLISILLPINHTQYIDNLPLITHRNNTKTNPHIFLFTCESCNAENMSLYGYEGKTTPFIDELSNFSLVNMNSFSNAQGTTGAITSILTGKYPMDTRVVYAPGILRGNDSYQHLPGILKNNGYYTVQISFNWYADAYDLNFLNGFSEVNGRHENSTNPPLAIVRKVLPTNYTYFIFETTNRIIDRLAHIYNVKDMENSYEQVTEPTMTLGFNDDSKLKDMIALLDNID